MIHDDETKIELSNKPKLILIILTSCIYGFVIYYFIFALKQRLRVQNIKGILLLIFLGNYIPSERYKLTWWT